MNKKLLVGLALALVVITVGAIGCYGDFGFPQQQVPEISPSGSLIVSQQNSGIWVTGEGKISVVPDVAMLGLGVEAQAMTVVEAQEQAVESMAAVMAVLDSYGIAEKDIQTKYFSIYPVWRWQNDQEILVGYRVNNTVTVKIRKVDETGAIIDAVVAAGGDYTRINSISFTVDDPTDYYDEVRELAIEDAQNKAKQLAKLAGVELGTPTYINEGSIYVPTPYDFYRGEAMPVPAPAPTTPISAGETEIRLTVQIVYNIG